jgi:hypothetical protein
MDLFKFPFHADVWGTASEWVMIIVTTVTAYFLWKTLQSQKEVQETQNRFLKIEQLRVKEAFKPKLSYTRFLESFKIEEPDKIPICIAVRNTSLSPALNFNCTLLKRGEDITQFVFKPQVRTLAHDGPYAELFFLINHEQGKKTDCLIYFEVEYEDVAGTRYHQLVIFDSFAGIEEFRAFDPKIVKDVDV